MNNTVDHWEMKRKEKEENKEEKEIGKWEKEEKSGD